MKTVKRSISTLLISVLIHLQYAVFANSPCHTGFAIGYAAAQQAYNEDLEGCSEVTLPPPCIQEATMKFNNEVYIVEQNFNYCCCVEELSCCS